MKQKAGRLVLNDPDNFPLAIHAPDKTDNYIKRCIGVSGDTLQIKSGDVYINGVKQAPPAESLMPYVIETKTELLDADAVKEMYGVDLYDPEKSQKIGDNKYQLYLTPVALKKMQENGLLKSAQPILAIPRIMILRLIHMSFVIDGHWIIMARSGFQKKGLPYP